MRWILLSVCLIASTAWAEDGDPWMRKMEAAMASPGETVAVQMQLVAGDGSSALVRNFDMHTQEKDGKRQALLRFTGPGAVAGTALLTVLQGGRMDSWVYLPATEKPRRIAPQDKTDRFVGSQFTIEDMTVSVDPEARRYTVLGEVDCGQARRCVRVQDEPRTEAAAKVSGYGKVVLYIDTERHLAHRIDFYDKADALSKVMTNDGLVPVGDRWAFDKAVVTEVATGDTTIMTVLGRKAGVDVGVFSPAALGGR